MTKNATLADLTSLEHLLATMMSESKIPPQVVDVLWQLFGKFSAAICQPKVAEQHFPSSASTSTEVSKVKRRGALTLLSMFSKTNKSVLADKVDLLLRVGLSRYGRDDFELARLTCVALQHLIVEKQAKGSNAAPAPRESADHPMFRTIVALLLERTRSMAWFGFTEQALNTIYLLCDHPDVLCGKLVKQMTATIFNVGSSDEQAIQDMTRIFGSAMELSSQAPLSDALGEEQAEVPPAIAQLGKGNAFDLSKLLFLIGHVAIKQIVHLENVETESKRRKAKGEFVPSIFHVNLL